MAESEIPLYRIRQSSYIEGVGVIAPEPPAPYIDRYIGWEIEARNTWQPLNAAAREAFRQRDEKNLANSKKAIIEKEEHLKRNREEGVPEEELGGLIGELAELRTFHAQLPRKLKQVPVHGKGVPEYSLSEHLLKPEAPKLPPELVAQNERMIDLARAGGATESDVRALKKQLGMAAEHAAAPAPSGPTVKAAAPKGRKAGPKVTAPEEEPAAEESAAAPSGRVSDS